MIKHCLSVNEAFLEPLPYSEIKATAKSIATYCWKKDAYCYQEFIDRQSRKGVLGGKAKGISYQDKKHNAIALKDQGKNNTEIAKILNVSRRTIIRWLEGV